MNKYGVHRSIEESFLRRMTPIRPIQVIREKSYRGMNIDFWNYSCISGQIVILIMFAVARQRRYYVTGIKRREYSSR